MILRPKTWLSSSGSGAPPHHRLRLGAAHDEWNHVAIALVAMEAGFFADEGLTEVELITFDDEHGEPLDREKIQVDLLAQGAVDIGIDPRASFVLQAKDRSRPVCIVAARRKNHAFVLIGRKGLRSVQELRGETVKMGHPGGATDVMMRQVLKDSGLEPDKDIEISYVGGAMHDLAGVAQAFTDGKYGPAFLAATAEADRLVAEGYPVLADLGQIYPSRHDRVTAANESFCRNHPDLLKGFLKGMIRGCRYVLDDHNRERFKEIIIAAGFMTTERERQSFDGLLTAWHERISVDLSLPADGVQLIVDEQKQAGHLSPSFKTEDVLRLSALHEAQRELSANSAPLP
jgi:NitT/TauT family transport system substrate-binding protein